MMRVDETVESPPVILGVTAAKGVVYGVCGSDEDILAGSQVCVVN